MRPKFEDGIHVSNCQRHVPGGGGVKMTPKKKKKRNAPDPGLQWTRVRIQAGAFPFFGGGGGGQSFYRAPPPGTCL